MTIRVFDCFPFFNELDLLELRLTELWDVVDVFVIAEATKTFIGEPKPLIFEENKERFERFSDKIRHIVVDDFPEGAISWDRERHQRIRMKEALWDSGEEDIVLFSDLDEIPRASIIADIKNRGLQPHEVYCLSLDWRAFYLNIRMKTPWERQGPRLSRISELNNLYALRGVLAPTKRFGRDLIRQIKSSHRMGYWVRRILIPNAGWHLTSMGGLQAVVLKGSAFSAHSGLKEGQKDLSWADEQVQKFLGGSQSYEILDMGENLPDFVQDNPDMFNKYYFNTSER